jgi:hypothetical protein
MKAVRFGMLVVLVALAGIRCKQTQRQAIVIAACSPLILIPASAANAVSPRVDPARRCCGWVIVRANHPLGLEGLAEKGFGGGNVAAWG